MYMKEMQGKPLESARSRREDLTIEKNPTSLQPSHLRSLGFDGKRVQESVCWIGEKAGICTMMPPSIDSCHEEYERAHINSCLGRQVQCEARRVRRGVLKLGNREMHSQELVIYWLLNRHIFWLVCQASRTLSALLNDNCFGVKD